MGKTKILFLCTGNSCRSQMAEAWAAHLKPDSLEVRSAGIEKHGLNPHMLAVMQEAGVATEGLASKLIQDLESTEFDYVVTLCGHANETCPFFPGPVKRVHMGFDDPPALGKGLTTDEEILPHYRRVRDEIRDFIASLPASLEV